MKARKCPTIKEAAVPTALVLTLAAAASCFALDWPLSDPRIAATFGTPARARLVAGCALASELGTVRAAGSGELAYSVEDGAHPAGLPTPLGSFLVVEHEGGMAAVYAHLAPDTSSRRLREARPGAILGTVGNSGWTEGKGMLFQVFDRKEGAWVNPLLLLPPLVDKKAPIIRSVALVRGGKSFVLSESGPLSQGIYAIAADVADPGDAPWTAGPLAPYVLRLAVDGVEIVRDVFDVARGEGGRFSLFALSPRSLGELRSGDGRYVLAERLFARGKSTIELTAEDASGNKRSSSSTVSIE